MRDSFAPNYARVGPLLSVQGLALGLGQPPISALGDCINKERLIAAGLIGVGLTGIAVTLTTSSCQLIPLLVLTGLLAATYHAPAAAFLADVYGAPVVRHAAAALQAADPDRPEGRRRRAGQAGRACPDERGGA